MGRIRNLSSGDMREGRGGRKGRGMVRVAFFFAFGVLLRCAELHSDCED